MESTKTQFSWIPFYGELGRQLAQYEAQQAVLLDLIRELHTLGSVYIQSSLL
jgi:hypothetical protein